MLTKLISLSMIGLLLCASALPARAGMISTGDAMALDSGDMQARVEAFLLRDDVAAELAQYGVSHEMAMARVNNLSPEELQQLSGKIEDQPAGAGVVGLVGAVFIVLLVLEIVGITNVFTGV